MKIKRLYILLAIVLLTIGTFGIYGVGKSVSSAHSLVEAFEEAIHDENARKVNELLASTDEKWEFTEKDAEDLIAFFKEQPDKMDTIVRALKSQATAQDTDTPNPNEPNLGNYGTIKLFEAGDRYVVFKDYKLAITPAMLQVMPSTDDSTFQIDGETLEVLENAGGNPVYGPLWPGDYTVTEKIPSNVADITESKEVLLFTMKNEYESVDFDLDIGTIKAAAPYPDTELLINDEKVGITLNETSQEIGPLRLDGESELKIEKTFPWGTVESQPVSLEDKAIEFRDFQAIDETMQNELMESMNKAMLQRLEARRHQKIEAMEAAVSDNYREELEDEIKEGEYSGELHSAYYNVETMKQPIWNEEEERYELKVEVEYHIEGAKETSRLYSNEDGRSVHSIQLTTHYSEAEQQWIIDDHRNEIFLVPKKFEKKFTF
ncbi:TcaA 3rd/4th domain-containing protein [Thalassobacillus hwangdonensis]|uniref:DUF4340 domain-containing protein n=1 Tax=Thalassobacillus hwangdonensis TaxID=546108 RepID=A0ABW3KXJ5_9BACI